MLAMFWAWGSLLSGNLHVLGALAVLLQPKQPPFLAARRVGASAARGLAQVREVTLTALQAARQLVSPRAVQYPPPAISTASRSALFFPNKIWPMASSQPDFISAPREASQALSRE